MTKRTQARLEDAEYRRIQRIAKRHRMTLAEWVRQALRGDVDQMLEEIGANCESDLAA